MFNNLSPSTQKFIAISAAIVAILALVTGAVGFLVAGLGMLATVAWASVLPILGLTAGIVAVIAVIAGLVVGVIEAYKHSETFRGIIDKLWESMKAGAQAVWNFIKPIIQSIVQFFKTKFEELRTFWNEIFPSLKQAFENIWNGVYAFISPLLNAIVAVFKWAFPFIKTVVLDAIDNVKKIIDGALNVIMGWVKVFAGLFTGNWKQTWEGVKQIFSGATSAIWNMFELWGAGKIIKFVGFLGGQMGRLFKGIWDDVSSIFSSALGGVWNMVTGKFNGIVSFINGLGSTFYSAGRGLIDQIRRGIESAVSSVISAVSSMTSKIRDYLPFSPSKEGALRTLDELDFANPIKDSIYRGMPIVEAAMNDMLTLPDIKNVNSIEKQPPQNHNYNFDRLYEGANIQVRNDQDINLIAKELHTLIKQQNRGRGYAL